MDKIYVGKGIAKFEGKLIKETLCLSDIPKEHTFEYKGKTYVKLDVWLKKEPDEFGKTHTIEIDTFKPEKKS